jgi:creatinine amidohydrolase
MATAEMLEWSDADNGSVGHGGEWETSLQMYLRPHLVSEPHMVKDEWRLKFSDEIGKFARFPERRREMAHGVMGDPFVASAEKGEKLFNLYVERLSQLVREYSAAEPPSYFEFGSHCPYVVKEQAAV